MDGLLEALEPLVELVEARDDPSAAFDAAMRAVEAGDAGALRRALDDERFAGAALRYGGVLDDGGRLTGIARDQILRAQTLVAVRSSSTSVDLWEGVMTVPPYLKNAVGPGDVRETAAVLRDLISKAQASIVMASPFLDKGFHALMPEIAGFMGRGGRFLLLTSSLLESPHNAGVVRELRDGFAVEHAGPDCLEVVSWEEEGLGLHTKALVADSGRAYVGSANFTWYGMGQQAELGVLLEGPRVAGLERLLRSLATVIKERKRLRAR